MLYDCRSLADRDRGIAAAIEAVRNGELVVLPTDTVYGVGADAFTPYAVKALVDAKGGTQASPPVLIGSRHTLDGLVYTLPQAARDLVEAFWPGALTILVKHSASLRWDLGDDSGVVAVRMPLHPVALEVLRETGPMAVASANKIGRPAAQTADEAREQLAYSVRAYLEAGPAVDPLPSTIVDLTGDVPTMVREGAIDLARLRDVVPELVESRVA
ncbi:L-threonylcarbamoyladenylate synthase [Micromonospora sp. NPDC049903]|jgi:tRNA threonylcarbamoyl adenosine modification protein (Sua5/YciO/YrdC/YwlC family)|uniref:L-threonylcarbamoyladenylate synthase n=1 Tax=Micromonospora sp. NPDC049903 TaxID=3364276 RepID=UPI0037934A5D